MTAEELLAELRQVVDDTVRPYRWSDSRLLGLLAEGQDVFCEETGLFVDKTNFTIDTVADQADYTLDDRIIKVYSVWDGERKLGHYQEQDKDPNQLIATPTTFDTSQTSAPYAWQADNETGTITFYPTPNDVRTLTLRVWRYALNILGADDGSGDLYNPEIPTSFHRATIEYAAHMVHNDHDAENQDPKKAADHLAAFRFQYVRRARRWLRNRQATEQRIAGNPNYVVNP